MASRPPDLSSINGGTGLEDLLVTPQELHRNNTLDNMDGLELFTDTLFWDLDLARFLDGVDYSRDVGDARGLGSNSSSNESKSYGGNGLSEEDFFNAAAVARDPSSTLSATPGYDFLNFKFPATEDQGEHHISPSPSSPQYQHHHPISTVAATGTLDGVISPRTATTTASPPALMMPRSPSSPASPRSASHLSDYTFPPISSESGSSSSPPPPLHHHHHHRSASLSEQDAHILSIQESARIAAEEDKRRRNTAASARFRIKKKQRDQAIEKAAKEMADRVSDLEKKIAQLELENRWLRNLFVEKNAATATTAIETAKKSSGGGAGI